MNYYPDYYHHAELNYVGAPQGHEVYYTPEHNHRMLVMKMAITPTSHYFLVWDLTSGADEEDAHEFTTHPTKLYKGWRRTSSSVPGPLLHRRDRLAVRLEGIEEQEARDAILAEVAEDDPELYVSWMNYPYNYDWDERDLMPPWIGWFMLATAVAIICRLLWAVYG